MRRVPLTTPLAQGRCVIERVNVRPQAAEVKGWEDDETSRFVQRAFQSLGYDLSRSRSDWTAQRRIIKGIFHELHWLREAQGKLGVRTYNSFLYAFMKGGCLHSMMDVALEMHKDNVAFNTASYLAFATTYARRGDVQKTR
eukprot:Sspe_Gene.33642::Locus_16403_Transcript_1_2_Confidence_0.667_Length_468::g.33642::m.33642